MRNPFGFFGLLGLIGFLGFLPDRQAFWGFFGYFVFLRYFTVIPDELFQTNVRKAATPAFFVAVVCSTLALAAKVLTSDPQWIERGFAASLVLSLGTFVCLQTASEIRERMDR